jgi:IclR family transcriptional regulator, KDG regulon repressor
MRAAVEHQDDEERNAPPRAPLRVMQILSVLASVPEGASLAHLSEHLQLPKTSVFSLLKSLEAGGYVASAQGRHRLGPEAFNLAAAISHQEGLRGRLRAPLERLQRETGETVMLAVPAADWTHLVFADVIEAESSLRFTARVGAQRPLYSTSVGLALLAFATALEQKRYADETELVRLTPDTISSAAALHRMLQKIRREGHVIYGGSVEGATGIAAPVFGPQGRIAASVSVAGPSSRIASRAGRIVAQVLDTGRAMSQLLGHAGPYPIKTS